MFKDQNGDNRIDAYDQVALDITLMSRNILFF